MSFFFKIRKIMITVGTLLLAVGLFLMLSASDVVRLNPSLEGTSYFQMASKAKETDVTVNMNIAVPMEQVPEDHLMEYELSPDAETPSPDAQITSGTSTYTLFTFDEFAMSGGKFSADKYGALRTVTVEEVEYAVGKVDYSRNLWLELGGWGRFICGASVVVLPFVLLGGLLLAFGLVLSLLDTCKTEQISVGRYLGQKLHPRKFVKFISDNAIVVGIILLAAAVGILRPNFISESNIRNLLSNTAVRFIIAVGVSGCLITKGTDLSAGRVTGLAACVSAIMLQRAGTYASKFYPSLGNLPIIPVLLLVLVLCALIGAANGTVVSVFKVPPFIATLGMQTLVYGICLVYTGAQPIGNLQSGYTNIALGYVGNRMLSYIAIIALFVGILMWFLYNKTRYGKYMYAIGGNEVAAEVAGINTRSMKIKIYMLAAVLYGLTGFLMAAKSGGASVNTASGYELEAIAGCTIGGVSVNGGVGRISGILIGVTVFELLKIALQFMGVESSYTYVVQGLVIIVAVALDLRKYLARK